MLISLITIAWCLTLASSTIIEPKIVVKADFFDPKIDWKKNSIFTSGVSTTTPFAKGEKYWEWVGVNVRFPNEAAKKIYEATGRYCKRCMLATRFQWHPVRNEVYIIFPRYKPGVAITLAKIEVASQTSSPAFFPYPNWSLQEEGNCDSIQSAVDIALDSDNLLWVLDSGVTNTLRSPVKRCSPKVFVISTNTRNLLKVIDLSILVTTESRLQYLVVDEPRRGRKFLYISDAGANCIIVWDVFADRGWRVILPAAVLSNSVTDTLYLALVKYPDQISELYFTYLSSSHMFSIRTEYLRHAVTNGRVINRGVKPGLMVLFGVSGGTKICFRFENDNNIYQWDTQKSLNNRNFILLNEGDACENCRITTHVTNGPHQVKYGLESNFVDYIKDTTGSIGASMALYSISNKV